MEKHICDQMAATLAIEKDVTKMRVMNKDSVLYDELKDKPLNVIRKISDERDVIFPSLWPPLFIETFNQKHSKTFTEYGNINGVTALKKVFKQLLEERGPNDKDEISIELPNAIAVVSGQEGNLKMPLTKQVLYPRAKKTEFRIQDLKNGKIQVFAPKETYKKKSKVGNHQPMDKMDHLREYKKWSIGKKYPAHR